MLSVSRLLATLGLLSFAYGRQQTQNPLTAESVLPVNRDRSVQTRELSLRYSFYHDLEDVGSPATFAHVNDLLESLDAGTSLKALAVVAKAAVSGQSKSDQINSSVLAPQGPDISDRATVINLAKMTSDAYVLSPGEPDWLNTSLKFNYSSSFGWDGPGLRGHVFADMWNKTIVVAFKGTTVSPGEKWSQYDRLNDNLLFSCCCGAQRPDPYPYQPVCNCSSGTYQCDATCLTTELGQNDRYYATALGVMANMTRIFPDSEFWVVGHSLGGAVASLMGLTYNFPAVTYESPPERLPAQRLGLVKPGQAPTYHIGNTADPIFEGACNGWSSSCGIAGYAFESQCFTGWRCAYDTVTDFNWHLSIANHRINTVITEVLEKYNTTPSCTADEDSECADCYNWNFATKHGESALRSVVGV
jgi:lipase ATG15